MSLNDQYNAMKLDDIPRILSCRQSSWWFPGVEERGREEKYVIE